MESSKTLFWLTLVSLAATNVLSASVGTADNLPDGDIVLGKTTDEVKPEGRFLDDLFEWMDMKVEKFVNQGSSVIQQVQKFHGTSGGTKIIKTEITQSFGGNAPFSGRYKRDLSDKLDGFFDTFVNKVDAVKDKVTGVATDVANVASLHYIKAKDVISNKLRPPIVNY